MDDVPWGLLDSTRARRVAYFHGSIATWAHREKYAAFYGERGWRLATSTLDYASELPAVYLPPHIGYLPRARLRSDDEPLIIAHTPTNPSNCHTAEFLGLTQRLRWTKGNRIEVRYVSGAPHADVLTLKGNAHACFDHLRGSFSVNTLEAAAMGLVPLVGVNPAYVRRDPRLAPRPSIESLVELRIELDRMVDDAQYTRELQREASAWFERHFSAAAVTKRLVDFYTGLK
jgi:hypothetical protein